MSERMFILSLVQKKNKDMNHREETQKHHCQRTPSLLPNVGLAPLN